MMALTDKLNFVVDCFPKGREELDLERLALDRAADANNELIARIKNNRKFQLNGKVRMLDIGSGDKGSNFVNRYGKEFPKAEITYLDKSEESIKKLNKKNKVPADASNIPFPDNYFDIAYAGAIINSGVLKDNQFSKDESYKIAKETYRVLKDKGLFIFTYVLGDDLQTLSNLSEIGFRELAHLLRIVWYGGTPIDTYAATK